MLDNDNETLENSIGDSKIFTSDEIGQITHIFRQGRSKLIDLLTYFILDKEIIEELVEEVNFDSIRNLVLEELSKMSPKEKEDAAEKMREFRDTFGSKLREVDTIRKNVYARENIKSRYSDETFHEGTTAWLLERILFELSTEIIDLSNSELS
ncbi:MAG: hypothetical protein ABI721_04235 [Candidatus Dojkabacteria bacterium]